MTAFVRLEDSIGPVWVNPLQIYSVVAGDDAVYVKMPEDYRISLPIPAGATPEDHAQAVVGKINTGLVAEYK